MIKKEATFEMGSSGSSNFALAAKLFSNPKNFFVTEMGYFGLGPLYMRPGDMVVVFDGDVTPFLLRQVKLDKHSDESNMGEREKERFSPEEQYELIGECYVHGFMNKRGCGSGMKG